MSINRKGFPQAEHLPASPHIKVNVSAQAIADATAKNSSHCMTAVAVTNACNRRHIDATHVAVDIQTIRFSDPARGLRYVYLTPRPVQDKILRWDQGMVVEPFSFILKAGAVHPMNVSSAKTRKQKTVARAMKRKLKVARFRATKGGKIERVVGGREPPSVSQRREFGLRAYGGPAGEVRAS